jgi:hypothetical protein
MCNKIIIYNPMQNGYYEIPFIESRIPVGFSLPAEDYIDCVLDLN